MCSIASLSVRTVYVRTYVRPYVRTSVRTHIPHIVSRFNITFQIVSVIFQIVHVAMHGGCSAASLGMLSQSRRQRRRLQRCRIYPQVGDKSHWNSRERVLEPEELSLLQATDSDTERRERAKRAAEGVSPLTYAWANTSLSLAPQCLHSPSIL